MFEFLLNVRVAEKSVDVALEVVGCGLDRHALMVLDDGLAIRSRPARLWIGNVKEKGNEVYPSWAKFT